MKIKTKLITSLLSFFTLMICAIIIISYRSFSYASNNNNLDKLYLTSAAISKAVEEKMDNYFNILEYSAEVYNIAPDDNLENTLNYRLSLLNKTSIQTGVQDPYYTLKDGSTYSLGHGGLVDNFNAKELNREWFVRIFDGENRVVTNPYASVNGGSVMSLCVAINIDGKLEGTMGINLPLTEITTFTQDILNFDNIYLTRSDGYLMASNDTESIGKNLLEIHPELEDVNKLTEDGTFSFTFDKEKYVGSFTVLDTLGWKAWAFEKQEVINSASKNNLSFNIWLAVFSLLLSVIMITILSNSISKPLNIVTSSLEEISKGGGDLTKEIIVNSKDETFTLAHNFNRFTKNLRSIVTNIKTSAQNNDNIGVKLNNSSTHASSASLEITKNVETIRNQMEFLDHNINETTNGIYKISSNISQFKLQIDEQVSAVEESSASIEEMIASLDNVSVITNKKLESTKRLVNTTSEGQKLLEETSVSFKEGISDKISNIKDMVEVISNISDRTNLLAMNAAIEAAHAGEAGKGFAVVADEIRKMAEEAAHSSKSISDIITIIINSINSTDINIDNTSKAFALISNEVTEIDIALNEIASNTIELASGGHEILKAVSLLNDTTSNLSYSLTEIEAGSDGVTSAMAEVQNISKGVFEGVRDITEEIDEVSISFQDVSSFANDLGRESKQLTKEVDVFII